MSALLYTFMDIFNNEFQVEEETVQLKNSYPNNSGIMHKDVNSDINRVRERFLDSLHLAVTDKP